MAKEWGMPQGSPQSTRRGNGGPEGEVEDLEAATPTAWCVGEDAVDRSVFLGWTGLVLGMDIQLG